MATPELVTIRRVPLIKTGTYSLSTGETTFTESDLLSAVAAQKDPAVRNPILKFGHEKAQLTQQPAIGRVMNLEYDPEVQTLYGDYVGVPAWLASILPIAYPDRSVEGWSNMTTATGRTHEFILEAVSLLGEDAPGVSTLEDLYELFYGDGEPVTANDQAATEAEPVAVIIRGGAMPKMVSAAMEVDDVRRAYYESLGPDQMWWWIRSVRLDPNELIVDDDEGSLFRVPFTIADESVTFGDPVQVKIEYQDVAASLASSRSKPVAVYASRGDSRPERASKPEMKEDDVADLAAVAQKLGLPADASEADVLAKLDELNGSADPKPSPEQEPTPEQPAPVEEPGPDKDNPHVPEGMVLVDAEQFELLTASADKGAQAYERQRIADRDRFLEEAVAAGKFPPSRKAHYASLWDKDEEGTREFIKQLAAGAIPVQERGSSEDGNVQGDDAYPAHWLPEVQARKASLANGRRPSITFEERA